MTRQERAPSQRQLRVGEEIRRALSTILLTGEVRDPDLEGVSVTVSEVRVSPDLKNATAFVMPLAGLEAPRVMAALTRATPALRGRLARAVRLRFAPSLSFQLDRSFDEAKRIDALLKEVGARGGDGHGA